MEKKGRAVFAQNNVHVILLSEAATSRLRFAQWGIDFRDVIDTRKPMSIWRDGATSSEHSLACDLSQIGKHSLLRKIS